MHLPHNIPMALMALEKIFTQLNIFAQCRKYGVPLRECPQFLFLIMGLLIIAATLFSYFIGTRYVADPRIVALIIIVLALILLIIAFIITRSFEKLSELSRMKSEFVNIVSHQLRSPLTNLKWALELLMSGKLSKIEERQAEYFRLLKENTERMTELTSDLLIVSRLETAALSLKKEKVFLSEIVKKLLTEFEPFAAALNVHLKFMTEENLSPARADPSQIKLVIENLLDNAIRYTKPLAPPGALADGLREKKGEVLISLKRKDKFLLFEIQDNGIGIAKDEQKYIFQKFFRSTGSLRYQTQGSGLGLYIAKAIIERSGGKIGFESQENKGSRFWFTLPIT